jgi:FkbM family methyltransferase
MGSILYETNDVSFVEASTMIDFNRTHFKQFWSYENQEMLEKNINELLNLKHNFGFISMLNDNDVDKIHHKYYAEDIIINKKLCNLNDDIICDNYEKLNVSEFTFFVHKNDTCVADCLRTGVLYEKFALSYLKNFIDPDKNIIDIGANIGTHTVIYSNYTNKNVYSFEPQKVLYDILNLNVKQNNCDNVVTYNFGASDKNSNYVMNCDYSSKMNQGAFCIIDDDSKHKHTKTVVIECKKLDDINMFNIGYVKIDVEGHEYKVLQGMVNLLKENKPVLFIEIHDCSLTKYETLKILRDVGYNKFYKLSHCDYIFTV